MIALGITLAETLRRQLSGPCRYLVGKYFSVSLIKQPEDLDGAHSGSERFDEEICGCKSASRKGSGRSKNPLRKFMQGEGTTLLECGRG